MKYDERPMMRLRNVHLSTDDLKLRNAKLLDQNLELIGRLNKIKSTNSKYERLHSKYNGLKLSHEAMRQREILLSKSILKFVQISKLTGWRKLIVDLITEPVEN